MKWVRGSMAVMLYSLLDVQATYIPLREYSGYTFFDKFSYYGNIDNTTWGNVSYVDQQAARARRLTYVNSAGNAIIKVDNLTTVPVGPSVHRDSVRLTSLDTYGIGTLIIIDVVHIPYGCSVWPSFWTYGMQSEWPAAGEIDVIEAINGMDHNQIALHALSGCMKLDLAGRQSGRTVQRNCSSPQGCLVVEAKPNSYGPGFAAAGGGVFATQISQSGVYIWFWSRPDIPTNIKNAGPSSNLDIVSWDIPTATYPAAGCNISRYFPPQNLVLLISLCGVWAGVPNIYQETCSGSCVDQVTGTGNNYANAYWEVRYIRTYSDNGIFLGTPRTTYTLGSPNSPSATFPPQGSAKSLPSPLISNIGCLLLILAMLH